MTFEEWNTYWGLTGSVSMEMYAAGVLNLLGREAPALGVAQAYFVQPITEGAITVRPSTAQLDTAGTVFDEQTNRLPVVANGVLLTLPRCSLAVVDTEVRISDFSERGHSCPLKTCERSGGGQERPRSYCPSWEAMEKSELRPIRNSSSFYVYFVLDTCACLGSYWLSCKGPPCSAHPRATVFSC